MNSETAVIQAFESHEWDAEFYGALSAFSRLAVVVKKKANVLHFVYSLHKANSSLRQLFVSVYAAMEGRVPEDPNAEPVTKERLDDVGRNVMHLYRTINYIFECSRRAGLLNNSLSSTALNTMRVHSEELLSLADWVELLMQKDEVEKIFDRSSREKEIGEVFAIEQVI